jgi:hypothetical protein
LINTEAELAQEVSTMTNIIFRRIAAAAVLSTAPALIALGAAAVSDAATTSSARSAVVTTADQVTPPQARRSGCGRRERGALPLPAPQSLSPGLVTALHRHDGGCRSRGTAASVIVLSAFSDGLRQRFERTGQLLARRLGQLILSW